MLNALASVQSSTDNPKYARHFIGRYADRANATLANGDIDETEYLTLRAGGDDDYAEMFEERLWTCSIWVAWTTSIVLC